MRPVRSSPSQSCPGLDEDASRLPACEHVAASPLRTFKEEGRQVPSKFAVSTGVTGRSHDPGTMAVTRLAEEEFVSWRSQLVVLTQCRRRGRGEVGFRTTVNSTGHASLPLGFHPIGVSSAYRPSKGLRHSSDGVGFGEIEAVIHGGAGRKMRFPNRR